MSDDMDANALPLLEKRKSGLVIFFFVLSLFSPLSAGDKFYFMIRVDDIMSRNTTILPRSIIPFQDTVESRGAFVSWAVIPSRLIEMTNSDGAITHELKRTVARGHEILIHGYVHICQRCGDSGHEMFCAKNNSAFSYAEQKKLLVDGQKILADSIGAGDYGFVPPGHFADTTTYRVLLDRGISRISTTQPTRTAIFGALYNVAPNNEYTWQMTTANYISQLHAALADIRTTHTGNGYYCLLLHDYFIRAGYSGGIVLRWTGELLDSLKKEYGSDIVFTTLREASKKFAVTGVTAGNQAPSTIGYSLSDNYPNPFNPSTTIRFSCPDQARVSLILYDALGREVQRLVDGTFLPGVYEQAIDGSVLASGVYFCRLSVVPSSRISPIFITLKKLVLLR